MANKAQAIQNLRPGAEWVLRGDDLEWLSTDQTEPTDAEITAEMARIDAEWAATEYQRLRKAEYNKLNQFEMQFDDAVNGTTTWLDAINAIKAKYPKG